MRGNRAFHSGEADYLTEADNLRRYVAGEPLLNVVDKKAGYCEYEQKRWRDADAFLDEAGRVLPAFVEEPLYINYIRWRRGECL